MTKQFARGPAFESRQDPSFCSIFGQSPFQPSPRGQRKITYEHANDTRVFFFYLTTALLLYTRVQVLRSGRVSRLIIVSLYAQLWHRIQKPCRSIHPRYSGSSGSRALLKTPTGRLCSRQLLNAAMYAWRIFELIQWCTGLSRTRYNRVKPFLLPALRARVFDAPRMQYSTDAPPSLPHPLSFFDHTHTPSASTPTSPRSLNTPVYRASWAALGTKFSLSLTGSCLLTSFSSGR